MIQWLENYINSNLASNRIAHSVAIGLWSSYTTSFIFKKCDVSQLKEKINQIHTMTFAYEIHVFGLLGRQSNTQRPVRELSYQDDFSPSFSAFPQSVNMPPKDVPKYLKVETIYYIDVLTLSLHQARQPLCPKIISSKITQKKN